MVLGLLAAAAVACGESIQNPIQNPTGSCEAPDSGARAGYHAPGDSTWLPDCENPRRREYWRVFAVSSRSAYSMPRLDGEPWLQTACMDSQDEVAPLVQKYLLCALATSPAELERINDMDPAEALRVTNYLHSRFAFGWTQGGVGIEPFPIPSDIIDACLLRPADNSQELNAICDREVARMQSGQTIGFSYTGTGAAELATRLNDLYGILTP